MYVFTWNSRRYKPTEGCCASRIRIFLAINPFQREKKKEEVQPTRAKIENEKQSTMGQGNRAEGKIMRTQKPAVIAEANAEMRMKRRPSKAEERQTRHYRNDCQLREIVSSGPGRCRVSQGPGKPAD